MKSRLLPFSAEIQICLFILGILLLFLFSAKPILCQESSYNTDEEKRRKACQGHYSLTKIQPKEKQPSGEKWILRDKDNNITFLNLSEECYPSEIDLYNCVDIDNDGQKEAVIDYYTHGAHCCFEYYIYGKESAGLQLIQSISLGEYSNPMFQDINKDGLPEIVALNDSLAYFAGLCHACSPSLPLVLCYRNKKFSDCTDEFPVIIDQAIKKNLMKSEKDESLRKGIALQYLALHIIKGKKEEGWRGVKKYYPESYSWLRENAQALNKILSKQESNRKREVGHIKCIK